MSLFTDVRDFFEEAAPIALAIFAPQLAPALMAEIGTALTGAEVAGALETAIGSGVLSAGTTLARGGDPTQALESGIIGAISPSISGEAGGGVTGAIASGAVGRGAMAALSGADVLKAALKGGVVGGVSSSLSDFINSLQNTPANVVESALQDPNMSDAVNQINETSQVISEEQQFLSENKENIQKFLDAQQKYNEMMTKGKIYNFASGDSKFGKLLPMGYTQGQVQFVDMTPSYNTIVGNLNDVYINGNIQEIVNTFNQFQSNNTKLNELVNNLQTTLPEKIATPEQPAPPVQTTPTPVQEAQVTPTQEAAPEVVAPSTSEVAAQTPTAVAPVAASTDTSGAELVPPVSPVAPKVEVPTGPITDQEIIQQIQPKTDVTAPVEPVTPTTTPEVVAPVVETPVVSPETPTTQETVSPEASVSPADTTQELTPAVQTLPEVEVTAEPETPTRDQQILDLIGLAPEQPVTTLPEVDVTAEPEPAQVDPFVDIAPPTEDVNPIAEIPEGTPAPEQDFEPYPEKKTDYSKAISSILNTFLGDTGSGGIGARSDDLGGGGGPGSQALAQALRVDAGAPIFGGEKKGKRRNVWNIESLRTKDKTGA